jgi:hypothetical protein
MAGFRLCPALGTLLREPINPKDDNRRRGEGEITPEILIGRLTGGGGDSDRFGQMRGPLIPFNYCNSTLNGLNTHCPTLGLLGPRF